MKKIIFIILFLGFTSLIFCQRNNPEHYSKGSSSFGITCFPIVNMFFINYGYIGYNICPSYSYFLFKNFSISGSVFYENDYAITGENTRITVNMIHASFALRYYFWRSRFFIEGSYNYGFSKLKGSIDYFEQINNPGIGIGMNGTFFENYGIFTGKLSWEYSTKLRISTSYAPVNSYQSFNRFAIVYHF